MTTTKPTTKVPAKPTSTRRAAPAKRAAPAPAKPAKATVAVPVAGAAPAVSAAPKVERPKKPKLVRDSFTIPKTEYLVIDELKARCLKLGRGMKKSELLRAGLKALAAMNDSALQRAMAAVPAIKTGRPKG